MKKYILFVLIMITIPLLASSQDGAPGLSQSEIYIESITIYPNPADRYLYITSETELNQKVEVSVFNLMGGLELTKKFTPSIDKTVEFDLIDLKKGLYFIIITTGNEKTTKRIYVT
jgi:hypothetical protein